MDGADVGFNDGGEDGRDDGLYAETFNNRLGDPLTSESLSFDACVFNSPTTSFGERLGKNPRIKAIAPHT